MRKRSLSRIITAWTMLALVTFLSGDVSLAASDVGRNAADFLLIGQGARAAGLGGAYTAVSDGAVAAYWNPAGLTSLEDGQVSLGHFSWFQDITVEQASLGFPISESMAGAASVTYVNYGRIEGFDVSGNATGELSVYDWSGGLSLGYSISESISLGITGKYVSQRLDDLTASAFAADLGLRYVAPSFSLAVAVLNIGSELQFDRVPEKLLMSTRIGFSCAPFADGVLTSLELEKHVYGDLRIKQGFELGFDDQYYLRTGYDYLPAQNGRSLATRISIGAGVRLDLADIDYAFTPNDKSTAEDLHRFTLTFRFSR